MQKLGFYVGMNEVANATNKVDRNTHKTKRISYYSSYGSAFN